MLKNRGVQATERFCVVTAKQNGVHLEPALVKIMLDKGMFLFGYMNLLIFSMLIFSLYFYIAGCSQTPKQKVICIWTWYVLIYLVLHVPLLLRI